MSCELVWHLGRGIADQLGHGLVFSFVELRLILNLIDDCGDSPNQLWFRPITALSTYGHNEKLNNKPDCRAPPSTHSIGWLHREHAGRVHVSVDDGCRRIGEHDQRRDGTWPGPLRGAVLRVHGIASAAIDRRTDRRKEVSASHELCKSIILFVLNIGIQGGSAISSLFFQAYYLANLISLSKTMMC